MTSRVLRVLAAFSIVMAVGVISMPAAGAATATAPSAATQAAAVAMCTDATFGGSYICAYGSRARKYPSGTRQMFVIGPDMSVYARSRNTTGHLGSWVNLGGEIRHSYQATDFWLEWCPGETKLTIYVRGTTGAIYNKVRSGSGDISPSWRAGTTICFDDNVVTIPPGVEFRP